MTIFLISIHVEKSPPAFPLAAAILKTALLKDGRTSDADIRLPEYYLPLDTAAVAETLIAEGADFYCFSAYTWNSAEIISLAAELKNRDPNIKLIVGGPQATAMDGDFKKTGHFDRIIRGEGEDLIAQAVKESNADKTVFDAVVTDFERSASPYPAVMKEISGHDGILWEVARGCPYSCSFCYESRGCKTVRTIPDNRIISELKTFKRNNVEKIWVLDPTFNHSTIHAQKVLEAIINTHPDAHYTFEIRAELMSEKLCDMLSGLSTSLQIGLQTTNPAALKQINRSLAPQKFLDKCRMMSDYGLTYGIDLIYGLPDDNYESFCKSLDFAVSAGPNNIDIFPLSVLPGTELAEHADKLGIIDSGFPHYTTDHNNSFTKAEMSKAALTTEAVDSLYNKEQAFSWFNTAAAALHRTPSALFESFSRHRNNDALDFIRTEFRRSGKKNLQQVNLLQVVESFIRWSRAAESAFANPGREIRVKLCRKPEVLDKLVQNSPEDFLRRHPSGKERSYKIFFDGEELYIN
ncbi:MAG TPA: hypothetical protein DCO79_07945 [Spirochaeta sp.]|nr:hypothetical protein [Spirochaeta sp.]